MIKKDMDKQIKIKVPAFADDQLAGGKYIWPLPFLSFMFGGRGTITIQNGILSYKESSFSSPRPKSFDLDKISKILVVKTKYPLNAKDFKLFSLEVRPAKFYLELFLIYKNGEKHVVIPSFVDSDVFLSRRQWKYFLKHLKISTSLPLEEIEVTASNKDVK